MLFVCCFIIAVIPFIFSNGLFNPTQTPQLFILLLAILAGYVIVLSKESISLRWDKTQTVLLGLLAFSGISFAFADHHADGYLDIFSLIAVILMIPLLKACIQTDIFNERYLSRCFMISSFVHICLGIATKFGLKFLSEYSSNQLGVVPHVNQYSVVVMLSIPFAVKSFFDESRRWKLFSGILIVLQFGTLLMVKTRSVWLALVLTLIIVALVCYWKKITVLKLFFRKWRSIKTYLPVIFVLLIGLISLVIWLDYNDINKHLWSIFKGSDSGRFRIWSQTVEVIQGNFWIGTGPGNWKLSSLGIDHIYVQRPHNDTLWYVSEIGIFGGILFILFYTLNIKRAFQSITHKKWDGVVWLSGLSLLFIVSQFTFPKERLTTWIALSVWVALLYRNEGVLIPKKALSQIFIIIIITMLVWLAERWRIERTHFHFVHTTQSEEELSKYCASMDLSKYNIDHRMIPIPFTCGKKFLDKQLYNDAERHLKSSLEVFPKHQESMLLLGESMEHQEKVEEAMEQYERTFKMYSREFRARVNLAYIHFKRNEPAKAKKILQPVKVWRVNKKPEYYKRFREMARVVKLKNY